MTTLQAIGALFKAFGHVLKGLRELRVLFPHLALQERQLRIQQWSGELLRILGVGLEVSGRAPTAGLVVANHISWLDILVLNAAAPVRFVSKADVRHWPVLGRLVEAAGTLFIERGSRRETLRVAHQMAAHLEQGHVLALFPEGTTSNGLQLLPFHANLLQAAIHAQCAVTPVALGYWNLSGQRSTVPAYIGNMTLLQSMWQTLRQGPVTARVVLGEAELAQDRERRQWSHDLRQRLQQMSGLPLAEQISPNVP